MFFYSWVCREMMKIFDWVNEKDPHFRITSFQQYQGCQEEVNTHYLMTCIKLGKPQLHKYILDNITKAN